MTSTIDSQEGEVAAALDDTSNTVISVKLEVLESSLLEILVTRPFESFGPGLVSEPVLYKRQ